MVLHTSEKRILKKSYPIICTIRKLCSASTSELLMVVLGYKPVTVNLTPLDSHSDKNLENIKKLASSIGLYVVFSKKYIVKNPKKIFIEISPDESHADKIIVSFSKSLDNAQKAADYHYKKMFDNAYSYPFGKLMGYPECCLRFGDYLSNNEDNPENFGFKNPAIESLKRSKHFDWRLNVFTHPPIPHLPCSLTCEASIQYAEKLLLCYAYINLKQNLLLKNNLAAPTSLYWTYVCRIFLYGDFKQYALGTGEIKYNKIESMITSDTFYQEVDNKKIAQWRNIENSLLQGNKLIVTDDWCRIYFNKKIILEIKKDNKYIPILVKPDLQP